MKDDEKSIEELCKPLSAKVMPKKAMHNIGGREMTQSRALASQRAALSNANNAKMKRTKKKDEE